MSTGPSEPFAPTRRRWTASVTAYLLAMFASASGSMALVTVLGKQVYDLTDSKLNLGLLGLVEFLPAAALVLVTGTVADRHDRRRVASTALVLEGMAVGGLAWYTFVGGRSIASIFALVLVFGVGRAFSAPPIRALPSDMVPPEDLPWLVPRGSASWQLAIVAGPVLGGFLYTVEPWLPYVAVVALFLVAAISVSFVRLPPRDRAGDAGDVAAPAAVAAGVSSAAQAAVDPAIAGAVTPQETPPPGERPGLREALEGLRFIRREPVLLGAISLDLFAVLFGGAVALLPAIAKDNLGVGAIGLGWLRAAAGIGAALVTLVLATRPLRRRVGSTLFVAVATFGAFTIVLGVTDSFAIAFVALAALSAADAVSVFIRSTIVPLVTPREKRGRVLAVENVFIGASNELGAFESGVAGQLLGTAPAVVLGGTATLAIAVIWSLAFPALRKLDRFPGADGAPRSHARTAGSGDAHAQ